MELLFQKYELEHLERIWSHSAVGEQTADVILPDSFPDADRILEAFGTLTLQDVECLTDTVSLSGTVLAGVLLVGENGQVYSLPVKIPFGVRKELGTVIDHGIPLYHCELRSVDARIVNSRKLLVRVGYDWSFEVYTPCKREIAYVEEPSEQLQLRIAEYPMSLPTVTGEKQFTLNEEVELPENTPAISEILTWHTRLSLLEQKAVGSKAVFKTELLLHLLYEDPRGKLCTYEWRLPVSQFMDLDRDAPEGEVRTILHLTQWELETDSSVESRRLFLRMGLRARAMVYEIRNVTLVEDAYCTDAVLEPQWEQWQLRPLLDSQGLRGTAQWRGEEPMGTVVDLWPWTGAGEKEHRGDSLTYRIPVTCNVIYYDKEGALRSKQLRPYMEGELPLHPQGECCLRDISCTEAYCNTGAGGMELRIPVQLRGDRFGEQAVRCLSGAELLPLPENQDPQPAVILRRTEEDEDLWSIAKAYRTSPKLISQANALDSTPIPEGTMLLIPLS